MSTDAEELQVTIAHKLPGRLRLQLSHPPREIEKTERMVVNHPGVRSAVYTEPTSNLLVFYDTAKVGLEEIVLRTAVCLSADRQLKPVAIKTTGSTAPLSMLSIVAGLSILAAHTYALFSATGRSRSTLEMLCGLGATAAVCEHIYLDMAGKGGFHPEVLSIGYLLSSFLRGHILRGATTAWIMTFTRHLLEPPSKVLKLQTSALDPTCDAHQCAYEAKISKKLTSIGGGTVTLLSHLPRLLLGMYTDTLFTTEDRIFKEIQKLSRENDDVLAGLEQLHGGIRLQVGS